MAFRNSMTQRQSIQTQRKKTSNLTSMNLITKFIFVLNNHINFMLGL